MSKRGRRARLAASLGWLGSLLCACGLSAQGTLDTPTEGGPALDASLDHAADAPASNNGSDADDGRPLVDAVVPGDAPPETSAAPDAVSEVSPPPLGWCATNFPTALFCDDFDSEGPDASPISGWNSLSVFGSLSISQAEARSFPNSLFLSASASASCVTDAVGKVFSSPAFTSTADLSFDIMPDSGNSLVATIFIGKYQVDVDIGQSPQPFIQQDDNDMVLGAASFGVNPTPGAWLRIGLRVALGANVGTITVTYDGATAGMTPILAAALPDVKGKASIYLGAYCYNTNAPRQLYYDNVLFQLE
jgi:hypothetical protein